MPGQRHPGPGPSPGQNQGDRHQRRRGFSLARTAGGKVLAWGENVSGQLGNGTTTSAEKPAAVMIPAGTTVRAISAGCQDSYALTRNGSVLAWGYNEYGELGDGTSTESALPVPVDLPGGWHGSALAAGPDTLHALVIGHRG